MPFITIVYNGLTKENIPKHRTVVLKEPTSSGKTKFTNNSG